MKIEKQIAEELELGIDVEKGIFSYCGSLGFDIKFTDIRNILNDNQHELYEDITALIFSPDLNLRKRFVKIWKTMIFSMEKLNYPEVLEFMENITISYGNEKFTIPLNENFILPFLKKFKFERKVGKEVVEATLNLEESDFILARIWADGDLIKDEKEKILVKYLKNCSIPHFVSTEEFIFFLNTVTGWNHEKDTFDKYFGRLVHIYSKAYRNSIETENFLKNNNVETYMVQGGRVLASNPVKLSEQKHHLWNMAVKLDLNKKIFTADGFDMVFDKNIIAD